jgi:hypothetical protein
LTAASLAENIHSRRSGDPENAQARTHQLGGVPNVKYRNSAAVEQVITECPGFGHIFGSDYLNCEPV